jgi:hypothetical protein
MSSTSSNSQLQLEESHVNTSKSVELEKEVKEKGLLIRKLRHEGAPAALSSTSLSL